MMHLARQFSGWLLFLGLVGGLTHAHPAQSAVWVSNGPEGGRVHVLAIDPATPSTLYAGPGLGGVFKSTDSGEPRGAGGVRGASGGVPFLPRAQRLRCLRRRLR